MIPRSTVGGAIRAKVEAARVVVEGEEPNDARTAGQIMSGINSMYRPAENIIKLCFCNVAGRSLLSASLPPMW